MEGTVTFGDLPEHWTANQGPDSAPISDAPNVEDVVPPNTETAIAPGAPAMSLLDISVQNSWSDGLNRKLNRASRKL